MATKQNSVEKMMFVANCRRSEAGIPGNILQGDKVDLASVLPMSNCATLVNSGVYNVVNPTQEFLDVVKTLKGG